MFRVINFTLLLRYVAIITTIVSICAYEIVRQYWEHDIPIVRILSITPWVALFVIFAITTNGIARQIWRVLKRFDYSLFPDLNGTWEGEIVTEGNLIIPVRALIRQTLLQTQIDIHTETSKSLTLETTPAVESGQCKLYYIYRSLPKNPNWSAYIGSTIFDVRITNNPSPRVPELSGYYFTDRKTNGRIRLQQVSNDVAADVSFY